MCRFTSIKDVIKYIENSDFDLYNISFRNKTSKRIAKSYRDYLKNINPKVIKPMSRVYTSQPRFINNKLYVENTYFNMSKKTLLQLLKYVAKSRAVFRKTTVIVVFGINID